MSANDSHYVIYVYYRGTPETRFDRDYYVTQHLPLCRDAWEKYGLLSLSAFYPAEAKDGTIAICEAIYRDKAAAEATFDSPEAAAVMADVARYTDATPLRANGVPL
nr:EthD family reductase [uncultured Massilia sp.]